MKTLIRMLAWVFPVVVTASLAAADHAGILAKQHVSHAREWGAILASIAISSVVLYLTRQKPSQQASRFPYRAGQR